MLLFHLVRVLLLYCRLIAAREEHAPRVEFSRAGGGLVDQWCAACTPAQAFARQPSGPRSTLALASDGSYVQYANAVCSRDELRAGALDYRRSAGIARRRRTSTWRQVRVLLGCPASYALVRGGLLLPFI